MSGGRGITPLFLTLALDGGECSASRSCRFTPCTVLIGGLVVSRAGLGRCGEEKNITPLGIEPILSSWSLYRLSYPDFSFRGVHSYYSVEASEFWLRKNLIEPILSWCTCHYVTVECERDGVCNVFIP
jgi:hypothetical protein